MTQTIASETLRNLVPLGDLTEDNLQDLAAKTRIERLSAGRTLFRRGDEDNTSYYLLAGTVQLLADGRDKLVSHGTAPGRFPLDHHRPRQATAVARTDISYIRIDNNLLDILLSWDQNAGYMVTEIETGKRSENTDWMTNILRSELFHRIPPANIQAMFMRLERVPAAAGDRIIRQGDRGDYYYYVHSGRCQVSRSTVGGECQLRLAELGPGDSFGEEALISGAGRNASVTMLTDGLLMRLSKTDFDALLKMPAVTGMDYGQACRRICEGATWLDVRLENERRRSYLPGSLHIPLYLLRLKAQELDRSREYIIYCDTGRRSSSAAYLLSERGFEASVLAGGLTSLEQGQKATG